MKNLILTEDHKGDVIGLRYFGDKRIDLVAIPYDYKYSNLIYFLSDEQGNEYGQFANLQNAILEANNG